MHRFRTVIFLCCLWYAGCGRSGPDGDVVVPPPGITTLQPVSVIDLSVHLHEPSGIFYNAKHKTLMVVGDGRPEVFEFTLAGGLVNAVMTSGSDMEGITMNAACDTIYIVEETRQLVTSFRLDGTKISSFPVNVATNPSNALEGITMDARGNLFVMNEKTPRLVVEYRGTTEVSRIAVEYTSDVSDICYDASDDCFWIVSDESKKVVKIGRTGALLGEWLIPFVKGEGITFADGKMYIVNDADAKMYVFLKP